MKKLLLALLLLFGRWPMADGLPPRSEHDEEWTMFKGNASYYSDKLHGRRMANGQPYHRDSMTCAHLKFPFGTLLKVRNPINNRTVIVRVTAVPTASDSPST